MRFFPCRWCDTAFEPVIDEKLLMFFPLLDENARPGGDLLAIHQCPSCGGDLEVKRATKYKGETCTLPNRAPSKMMPNGWSRCWSIAACET